MAALLVAEALWLLGQDEQYLRPRVGRLRVALTAAALVDVIDSGAARWAGSHEEPLVRETGGAAWDPLTRAWLARLAEATGSQPIPVIHAINALGPGTWEVVGADLARRGLATEIPRPVRRWLAPRRRPDREATDRARKHLRKVISGAEQASTQDHGVLSVALCAGVVEEVLSQTAFSDPSVLEPTCALLDDSILVQRLGPALSYLLSTGPGLGIEPSWPGLGS
jgi:hypothetical protein